MPPPHLRVAAPLPNSQGDKRIARAGLLERRGSRLRTGGLSTAELVERLRARKERRASGPMSRSAGEFSQPSPHPTFPRQMQLLPPGRPLG